MSKRKNTIEGVVESLTAKSLVVLVRRKEKNWLGKYVAKSTRIHVHDENSIANKGDLVTIVPSRPYSKQKTWKLDSVLEHKVMDMTQREAKS